MTTSQALALLGLVAIVLAFLLSVVWVWRDMEDRGRPRWLRLVVLITMNVLMVGFVIWLVDLARHPPQPSLLGRRLLARRSPTDEPRS